MCANAIMSEFDQKLMEDVRNTQEFLEEQFQNTFNPVKSEVKAISELVDEGVASFKKTNNFAKSFKALKEHCGKNTLLKTPHMAIKKEKGSLCEDTRRVVETVEKENVPPPDIPKETKRKTPINTKPPIVNQPKNTQENPPKAHQITKSETSKQPNQKVETLIKKFEEKRLKDAKKCNKMKPKYLVQETPLLPPDEKNSGYHPEWLTNTSLLEKQMTHAGIWVRDTLFSVQPMTLNLQEIFPSIETRKLKRTSSAIWTKNTTNTFCMSPVKECGSE